MGVLLRNRGWGILRNRVGYTAGCWCLGGGDCGDYLENYRLGLNWGLGNLPQGHKHWGRVWGQCRQ